MTPPTESHSTAADIDSRPGDQGFLKIAMVIVVVGCIMAVLLLEFLAPGQPRRLTGFALAAVAAAFTLVELQRGRLQNAYRALTYGAWIGITASAAINGGMSSPALLAYPVMILIAGWVMSTRTALVLAGLSLGAEFLFVVGTARQWLPTQVQPAPAWIAFVHALILVVSASLAAFVRRSFSAKLQEAQELNATLARRMTEIAARDQELRSQHVFQTALLTAQASAGIGMYIVEDERITYANSAACELFGYGEAELFTLSSFLEVIHLDDRQRSRTHYQRQLAGEPLPERYDISVVTRDGERREVEATVKLLPGEPPARVLTVVTDITERRRAESLARLSEERFARVFNISPIPISISRVADGRYLEVNDAFLDLFDVEREEAVGHTSLELGIWPDTESRQTWVTQLLQGLAGPTYETELLDRSGRRHIAHLSGTLIQLGGERCVLSFIYDMTEQRRSEAMLREIVNGTSRVTGADFFRALVRHLARALDVPFALVGEVLPSDPGKLHTLAFWSRDGFAPNMDYELATTPCGHVYGATPRLFCTGLAQAFPNAKGDGRAIEADSYYGHPLVSAAGEPLGVLAILDDKPMTNGEERASLMAVFAARAAAELERQRAEIHLLKSEQKFSRIFHTSPVAISITRVADGYYHEVNDAYVRHLGWQRHELIGHTTGEIGIWQDLEKRRDWVDTLHRYGRVFAHEAAMRDREGHDRIMLISAECLDFAGEECVLSFLYDITERKQAEAEIRQLNAELEDRVRRRTAELTDVNRELEAFAYSISHDLRAPLRGIDGFSRLLQEEYGDRLDDQGHEYLFRVRRATQRLGTLIDDMLELSRVSRREMRRERINLSALVADIMDDLRKAEPERTVEVVLEPDCITEGDPMLLRVLLENLVGNAWKYSRDNPKARIEFGRETDNNAYFVRDNGAGFDMAYADKLFKPFQRLHNPADFEGSGIGLASAARAVRRHGGRIWAESNPGHGAIFRFTLESLAV